MKGIKAGIIPCGFGIVDSNFIINFNTVMTWENPDVKPKWFRSPHSMVIIHHPDEGWILWDLGSRPDSAETWPGHITKYDRYEGADELDLEAQMALLGLEPGDIRYVILSHMHMDHTGYMDLFKDSAEFFVGRSEMMHACAAVMNSTDESTYGWYIRNEILCPVKKYHYIDRDTEIFPGITLITLPGHTQGSLGCILELESGTRILTGDAVTCREIYDGALPGFMHDSAAFLDSVRKVREYQKKYDAEIWFSHDPNALLKLSKWDLVLPLSNPAIILFWIIIFPAVLVNHVKKEKTIFAKTYLPWVFILMVFFAQFAVFPQSAAVKISKEIAIDDAIFAEPLNCVMGAVKKLKIMPGDRVLILGGGPIGLYFTTIMKTCGAGKILVSEVSPFRSNHALMDGADRVINPCCEDLVQAVLDDTEGMGADVVIDAVGVLISDALKTVKSGGSVLLFGMNAQAKQTISLYDITARGITVYGNFIGQNTLCNVAKLLESKRIDFKSMITHRMPLTKFGEGLEAMRKGEALEVVLYPFEP